MKKWLSSSIILLAVVWVVYALYSYFMKTTSNAFAPNQGSYLQDFVVIKQENIALTRTFNFYLPESLNKNINETNNESPAIIFVLHGSKSTGDKMRFQSGYQFDHLAQKTGDFIVVYPDGYQHHWNDCRASASYAANKDKINDPEFFIQMINYFVDHHQVNKDRIFATGFSNGGQMIYRLGLEIPQQFSALAVIAANLPIAENLDCHKSERPISIAIFNGSDDPINPYHGGLVDIFGDNSRGNVLSTAATVNYWAELNHLERQNEITLPKTDHNTDTSIVKTTWRANDNRTGNKATINNKQVRLYRLQGSGHVIPSKVVDFAKILGANAMDIEAAEEIWSFFKATENH